MDNSMLSDEDSEKQHDSINADTDNKEHESSDEALTEDKYNDLMKTLSSSSSSSSSSDEESNEFEKLKDEKQELKGQLEEVEKKLEEERNNSEKLKRDTKDEIDAKERIESNFSELQERYHKSLKIEEMLQSKLNNKTEYCNTLQKQLISLNQEIPKETNEDSGENEDIDDERKEVQAANQTLFKTYLSQIEQLDGENIALKHKISQYERDLKNIELNDEATKQIMTEEKVEIKPNGMGNSSNDTSVLQSEALEEKLKGVQQNCDENANKYKEAVVALKQVEEAYGKDRDEVLEKYKEEIDSLKEQLQQEVQSEHGKPNEGVVTALRQEVLDVRLTLERLKKNHKDEVAEHKKTIQSKDEHLKNTADDLDQHKDEIEKLKRELSNKQDILRATEELSTQRMHIINELRTELTSHKDNVKHLNNDVTEKGNEIGDLRGQILQQTEMLTNVHLEKKRFEQELQAMKELKENNQNAMEEIDQWKNKLKSKKIKVKYLKKQLKEYEDQKEKFEQIVLVVPEMQKKIDQLEREKRDLREELAQQIQNENNRLLKIEQEKREQEERDLQRKEDWERRLLGIGECALHHDGMEDTESHVIEGSDVSNGLNRSNSGPFFIHRPQPRPPSARRYKKINSHRRAQTSPSVMMNSSHLMSSREGRMASERVYNQQPRIIMDSKHHKRLSHSATQQMNHVNSYAHASEDQFFPKLNSKKQNGRVTDYNGNVAPRVLVWGSNQDEGAGKKLVAVGDHVSARVLRDCDVHGRDNTECVGLVKFIGFINNNEKDVYIGLRMEEEVGNTDGRVEGTRYFRCEVNRGKFVRLDDVVKIMQSNTMHHSQLQSPSQIRQTVSDY